MESLITKKTESAHGLDLGSGDGSRASKETGQIEGGKILTSYEKKKHQKHFDRKRHFKLNVDKAYHMTTQWPCHRLCP